MRESLKGFGQREVEIMRCIQPDLSNFLADLTTVDTTLLQSFACVEISGALRPLSSREVEIVQLVCHRLSAPQIARALWISHRTVERHIQNVYVKLGASCRRDMLRRLLGIDRSEMTEGAPNSREWVPAA
jgi:DNA-binding NarL/FixJ family response regulator